MSYYLSDEMYSILQYTAFGRFLVDKLQRTIKLNKKSCEQYCYYGVIHDCFLKYKPPEDDYSKSTGYRENADRAGLRKAKNFINTNIDMYDKSWRLAQKKMDSCEKTIDRLEHYMSVVVRKSV